MPFVGLVLGLGLGLFFYSGLATVALKLADDFPWLVPYTFNGMLVGLAMVLAALAFAVWDDGR